MRAINDLVISNENVDDGKPVFKGTSVRTETLFQHIANGFSLDEFIAAFPEVKREQAIDFLEIIVREAASDKKGVYSEMLPKLQAILKSERRLKF